MNVVIAIDSFKGSLSSMDAGEAARRGVLAACDASVAVMPLADGGEGTVDALVAGLGGHIRTATVKGPRGEPVQARWGMLANGTTAVMEMAEASGLTLVAHDARDPWDASTFGTGQMIIDALEAGCREFIIGIGGSATTEGGIGMLSALGWDFRDASGALLSPVLANLGSIARIDAARVPRELLECTFHIACDVSNPLCGQNGAVAVFGPQKGVEPEKVAPLDAAMVRYADAAESFSGRQCREMAGAGAAGGLGFAFLNFLPNAELRPGVDIVLDAIGLDAALAQADILITGEGRLDAQTAMGKAPAGAARLAKRHGCTVIAFAGSISDGAHTLHEAGIDAFFPIARGPISLQDSMRPNTARRNLELAVEQVFRLLAT